MAGDASFGTSESVTTMSTSAGKLTYEEWLNLPETKQRYEIVDGVMYMAPSGTWVHQRIQQRINIALSRFVESEGVGEVLTAPLDILVQREPLRTRQPDVLYLGNSKVPGDRIEDIEGIPFLEFAPDLAVEILSPSNTTPYMERKLRDYQQIGVTECWLFYPVSRTAILMDLTGNGPRSVATFSAEETLVSELLPGFQLSLREVFR